MTFFETGKVQLGQIREAEADRPPGKGTENGRYAKCFEEAVAGLSVSAESGR
jgi:hypothetical protein